MEREEALQYYNDYFNDAGAENEQDVIQALGSPEKVAENIKRDLYGTGYGDTEYQREQANDKALVEYRQNGSEQSKEKKKMSTPRIVLLVVVCVLAASPVLGVGVGLLGALVGIVVSWFSLILGFGVAAVALLAVLLVLTVVCSDSTDFIADRLGNGVYCRKSA